MFKSLFAVAVFAASSLTAFAAPPCEPDSLGVPAADCAKKPAPAPVLSAAEKEEAAKAEAFRVEALSAFCAKGYSGSSNWGCDDHDN